jgi:hypothetical protein
VSREAGPVPVTGGLLARSPLSFVNALNTRPLWFSANRPDFVKAKNGVRFNAVLYQNVANKFHFLLPLNCSWDSWNLPNMPIVIHLKPVDYISGVFVRVLTSELTNIDLTDERSSNKWTMCQTRDIIIRDIEELEEVKATAPSQTPPLLLTLKHPEQVHFRGFGKPSRSANFRSIVRSGIDILREFGYIHNDVGVDLFHIYRDAITPALTEDQACFGEHELLGMRFQADIKREVEPIELLVVVGFRNNDFAIKGWECHGEFHACIQLDSFANDYTATSDCTVLMDCNKPIKIALRPAPSQHRWNVETPVKEVTVTLTL